MFNKTLLIYSKELIYTNYTQAALTFNGVHQDGKCLTYVEPFTHCSALLITIDENIIHQLQNT